MKKTFIALVTLAASILTLQAQCDNAYFPMTDGITFEQTSYNAKDKEQGKTVSITSSTSENLVLIENKIYDKKGKLITEGDYEVICDIGTIKMDIQHFIPDELLESYQSMEVTIEGNFLEFPNELSAGQVLSDGNGKITVTMTEGMANVITMDILFTNRKVEKKETLTTPAGTFETFKISQTTISSMNIMGMSREMSFNSINWIAQGVGTVKTENYDKKGKLDRYTLLTKFEE